VKPGLRPLVVGATLVVASVAPAVPTAGAATIPTRSPIASIQDDRLALPSVDPAPRIRLMAGLGARVIRVDLRWDLVAKRRPANPRNPSDPAYDWRHYDQVVAAARASHVAILFTVWGTPSWAADRAATSTAGNQYAIRPREPSDFGAFGAAAASRYATRGVHMWEAWNEPNIPLFLRPQYRRAGGRWVPASPQTYSALLKSFYMSVKAVDRRARIGGAVTAPVGDQCPSDCPSGPDARVTPTAFLAELNAPRLRPPMDAYSHHPYPITGPRPRSFPRASYIDLYNLARLERALSRTYLAKKPLWLTEVGFSTRPVPEYPTFFSKSRQAEYLADAYRRVRTDRRVALVTWYFLQDNAQWTSGLLDEDFTRKPAFAAFALPIAPLRPGPVAAGRPVTVVGQIRSAAGRTRVTIQERRNGRWYAVGTVPTSADGSFTGTLHPQGTTSYRARWTGVTRTGVRLSRVSPAFVVTVTP
jgi:hypothetical protein